jgi:hypothetical protein
MDQDGDGKLTEAELDNARNGRGPGRGVDFATADTDGDGALSADELNAAMPTRRRDMRDDQVP